MARVAAWSIWLCAWLALGRLGQFHTPHALGGLWPLVVWMVCLIALLLAQTGKPMSGLRIRLGLALGFLAAIAGQLFFSSSGQAELAWLPWGLESVSKNFAMLLCAAGWALLVAHGSYAVRALREMRMRLFPDAQAAPPMGPAVLAAAVVALVSWHEGGQSGWSLHGLFPEWPGLEARGGLALLALGGLGAAMLALMSPQGGLNRPCSSGLFDCALSLHGRQTTHQRWLWALRPVQLAMLPMMATLVWMPQWCSNQSASPSTMVALHWAVMFAPAWVLHHGWLRSPQALHHRFLRGLRLMVVGLMACSLIALWPQGGIQSSAWSVGSDQLMSAALLQSCAWSLAWLIQIVEPRQAKCATPVGLHGGKPVSVGAVLTVLSLLLLGWAIEWAGPWALAGAMMVLAAVTSGAGLVMIGVGIREGRFSPFPSSSPSSLQKP